MMMPKISVIKKYFTIKLNGYYLTERLLVLDYFDILNHLTKNVDEIPYYLLFEDYDEARIALYSNISNHYLVRKNVNIEITIVYRMERVDIDKVQFYDANGKKEVLK